MKKNYIQIGWNWAFTFFLVTGVFTTLELALQRFEKEEINLALQLDGIHLKLKNALMHRNYLMRQINSQSDPAWIEMILKRDLGLVPEGQIKIYFTAPL